MQAGKYTLEDGNGAHPRTEVPPTTADSAANSDTTAESHAFKEEEKEDGDTESGIPEITYSNTAGWNVPGGETDGPGRAALDPEPPQIVDIAIGFDPNLPGHGPVYGSSAYW